VGFADLLILAQNYGKSVAVAAATPLAGAATDELIALKVRRRR